MPVYDFLLLAAGGFGAGIIGAMLGLGGGVFLIPYLVLVLNIPMHQAIATSIMAVIATSSAGAVMNLKRHTIHIRLGMVLETTTVAGAIMGGITASVLSGKTLAGIFSVLLIVVGSFMLQRLRSRKDTHAAESEGVLPASYIDPASGADVRYSVRRLHWTMLVSLIAGNISGLLGVGGGIFKVPAMNVVSGIPMKAATSTSNFMIGVTAAASAFIYFSNGHLNPVIAGAAAIGVLPGSMLGTRIAHAIHGRTLTILFVAILFLVAVQMFWRALS